ncbi:MAG: hypothetical protein QXM67_06595, partial [Candidatus Methanomethylicia archaeon]
KLIPLIFVPVSLKFSSKKVYFILSYFLSIVIFAIIPFLIFNWSCTGFYNAMLSQAFNVSETPAIGGMTIFSFLEYVVYLPVEIDIKVALTVLGHMWFISFSIFYILLYLKPMQKFHFNDAIRLYIIATLLFLSTRVFIAEQYATYLLGFMVIDIAISSPERKNLFNTICAVALTYLIINNTLLIRFLSPVTPWAFSWDINFNNSPPSETIRHIFRILVGSLFYVSVLQSLFAYLNEEKYVVPLVTKMIKNILNYNSIKYYLYLILLIFNVLSLDYIVINMITDWNLVLTKTFMLGLPLFSFYHIMLILLVIGFDIAICLFMNKDLERRIKTFVRLMLLNLLATGIMQPIFQILRGKIPLMKEPIFVICFLLDERIFVSYSVIGGIMGLFLFESFFNTFKRILKHLSTQRLKNLLNGG